MVRAALEVLRHRAVEHPWHGQGAVHPRHAFDTTAITEPGRLTRVLYTYDYGHHSSGWWRNSDYERCYHLSVSHPVVAGTKILRLEAPSDDELRAWAKKAWPKHWKMAWVEAPATVLDVDVLYDRRRPNVGHARLFLDVRLEPIMPEGEVYDLKPMADGSSPEKVYR